MLVTISKRKKPTVLLEINIFASRNGPFFPPPPFPLNKAVVGNRGSTPFTLSSTLSLKTFDFPPSFFISCSLSQRRKSGDNGDGNCERGRGNSIVGSFGTKGEKEEKKASFFPDKMCAENRIFVKFPLSVFVCVGNGAAEGNFPSDRLTNSQIINSKLWQFHLVFGRGEKEGGSRSDPEIQRAGGIV